MMIIGKDALSRTDSKAILATVRQIASNYNFVNAESGWNGFNVLHRSQGEINALELGLDLTPISGPPKVIFLFGCDNDIAPSDIPKDAFVVYIVYFWLSRAQMETRVANTQMWYSRQLPTLRGQVPTVCLVWFSQHWGSGSDGSESSWATGTLPVAVGNHQSSFWRSRGQSPLQQHRIIAIKNLQHRSSLAEIRLHRAHSLRQSSEQAMGRRRRHLSNSITRSHR